MACLPSRGVEGDLVYGQDESVWLDITVDDDEDDGRDDDEQSDHR